MARCSPSIALLLVVSATLLHAGENEALKKEAREGLRRASEFFTKKIARNGGYLWFYAADLSQAWGEGKVTATQIWVQPPGTPAVGAAFLDAYEATRDAFYLDAARAAADALRRGQLKSGAWTASIDFDPQGKGRGMYRAENSSKGRNTSTLDDDISTSALSFLMRLDALLEFKDAAVHETTRVALDALLAAQHANGGFTQVWEGPAEAREIVPAAWPEENWRERPSGVKYWQHYTLNDGIAANVVRVLSEARGYYKEARFEAALKKFGDFLLLAKLPAPQPAWAQQYDVQMRPAWARKFEPPAVSSWESQDVLFALLKIYDETGDAKYLAPVPDALAWLKSSLLPDGRLARFYETKTNKPLYMTREYVLTYDDGDTPTHYGFKQGSKIEAIEKRFARAKAGEKETAKVRSASAEEVRSTLAVLDSEGRWIDSDVQPHSSAPKGKYILCKTFVDRVRTLAAFVRE